MFHLCNIIALFIQFRLCSMSQLQLVKPLSRLREEQKESRISSIEIEGLTLLRGKLTELIGATSSGKTGYALGVLSKFTQEGL